MILGKKVVQNEKNNNIYYPKKYALHRITKAKVASEAITIQFTKIIYLRCVSCDLPMCALNVYWLNVNLFVRYYMSGECLLITQELMTKKKID